MKHNRPWPSSKEDVDRVEKIVETPQTLSPSYKLAFADREFILRDEMRSVRLELELLKPELTLNDMGISSTIVVFGSSRIPEPEAARRNLEELEAQSKANPNDLRITQELEIARRIMTNSKYYEEARKFTKIISETGLHKTGKYVVVTGGGPGIMEAANRGAYDAYAQNIGLNIVLPMEQTPNPYITPELCFQFH